MFALIYACNLDNNKYNMDWHTHPWLNWIEHRPPKAGIARSNRAGCAILRQGFVWQAMY